MLVLVTFEETFLVCQMNWFSGSVVQWRSRILETTLAHFYCWPTLTHSFTHSCGANRCSYFKWLDQLDVVLMWGGQVFIGGGWGGQHLTAAAHLIWSQSVLVVVVGVQVIVCGLRPPSEKRLCLFFIIPTSLCWFLFSNCQTTAGLLPTGRGLVACCCSERANRWRLVWWLTGVSTTTTTSTMYYYCSTS